MSTEIEQMLQIVTSRTVCGVSWNPWSKPIEVTYSLERNSQGKGSHQSTIVKTKHTLDRFDIQIGSQKTEHLIDRGGGGGGSQQKR